jgi:hypothetical protein
MGLGGLKILPSPPPFRHSVYIPLPHLHSTITTTYIVIYTSYIIILTT